MRQKSEKVLFIIEVILLTTQDCTYHSLSALSSIPFSLQTEGNYTNLLVLVLRCFSLNKNVSINNFRLLALPLVALPQDSAQGTRNKGNREKKCSCIWKAHLPFVFHTHFMVPVFFKILFDLASSPKVLLKFRFPF